LSPSVEAPVMSTPVATVSALVAITLFMAFSLLSPGHF
jgi:hypothetical protein